MEVIKIVYKTDNDEIIAVEKDGEKIIIELNSTRVVLEYDEFIDLIEKLEEFK